MLKSIPSYLLSNINIFNAIGGQYFFYLFFLVWILFLALALRRTFVKKVPLGDDMWLSVVGFIRLVFILSAASFLLGVMVVLLFHSVSREVVFRNTLWINHMEQSFFGTLLAVKMITLLTGTPVEAIIVFCYKYLDIFMLLALLFLAVESKKYLERAIFCFFLVFFAAIPVWLAYPIVSPDNLLVDNVFGNSMTKPLPTSNFSPMLSDELLFLKKVWVSDKGDWLAVSTLPSMHAAWCLIFAYFCFRANRKTAVVVLPFSIFVFIGTIYTLQHFVVDTVAGIILASMAVVLTERFSDFSDNSNMFTFIDLFKKELG